MLAEDYDVLREVTDAFLQAAGFSTIVVTSCSEANAVLGDPTQRIDVVITDLVMPGMSFTRRVYRLGSEGQRNVSVHLTDKRLLLMLYKLRRTCFEIH